MKTSSIILSLCLTLFVLGCKPDVQSEINVVSPQEMQELLQLDSAQLVDVRTAKEYKAGYIPNSQNIDFTSPTFEDDIKSLDKEKPVLLYCQKGGRSAKCAKKMKDLGFKKIYDLQGGFSKWKHDGFLINKKS